MHYLTISADYISTGIKDDFSGEILKGDLEISDDLWHRLIAWGEDYSSIILMEEKERKKAKETIKKLDERGLNLVKEFQKELGVEFKVRYYSEGIFKYLSSINDFK